MASIKTLNSTSIRIAEKALTWLFNLYKNAAFTLLKIYSSLKRSLGKCVYVTCLCTGAGLYSVLRLMSYFVTCDYVQITLDSLQILK